MDISWKEILISYGITLPLVALVWYLLSFIKKKVFIRWLIQVLIFLILSIAIIVLGIIIFLVKTEPINAFWFGVTFIIGSYLFFAFLASIYFLITRGIVFPKRKKRDYEYFKNLGLEEWKINLFLRKYDK